MFWLRNYSQITQVDEFVERHKVRQFRILTTLCKVNLARSGNKRSKARHG